MGSRGLALLFMSVYGLFPGLWRLLFWHGCHMATSGVYEVLTPVFYFVAGPSTIGYTEMPVVKCHNSSDLVAGRVVNIFHFPLPRRSRTLHPVS
jgi:hypothetical protein